jgi:hypothetical protein
VVAGLNAIFTVWLDHDLIPLSFLFLFFFYSISYGAGGLLVFVLSGLYSSSGAHHAGYI